jgi:hypothetical protein
MQQEARIVLTADIAAFVAQIKNLARQTAGIFNKALSTIKLPSLVGLGGLVAGSLAAPTVGKSVAEIQNIDRLMKSIDRQKQALLAELAPLRIAVLKIISSTLPYLRLIVHALQKEIKLPFSTLSIKVQDILLFTLAVGVAGKVLGGFVGIMKSGIGILSLFFSALKSIRVVGSVLSLPAVNLSGIVVSLGKGLGVIVQTLLSLLTRVVVSGFGLLVRGIVFVVGLIISTFGIIPTLIIAAVAIIAGIILKITGVFDKIYAFFVSLFEYIKTLFVGLFKIVLPESFRKRISEGFKDVATGISDTVKGAWSDITEGVSAFSSSVKNWFSENIKDLSLEPVLEAKGTIAFGGFTFEELGLQAPFMTNDLNEKGDKIIRTLEDIKNSLNEQKTKHIPRVSGL